MTNPEIEKINFQEETGLGEKKIALAIERGVFKRVANAKRIKKGLKILFEKKSRK